VRRALDTLYLWSGYLAAVFLIGIAVTVVSQIVGRFFGVAVDSTESAGFCMAGATFLGLAYTFKHGAHVRVALVLSLTGRRLRRGLELWAIGACVIGMAYFSYWACDFVYYSFVFREISPGLLAMPFWIPRLAMAVGAVIFTIALIDEFARVLGGAVPTYEMNAETVLGGTTKKGGE